MSNWRTCLIISLLNLEELAPQLPPDLPKISIVTKLLSSEKNPALLLCSKPVRLVISAGGLLIRSAFWGAPRVDLGSRLLVIMNERN